MKKRILLILVCSIFSANFLFSQQDFQGINGINTENYPRVDGSTSTEPLNTLIACKLFGWRYEWKPFMMGNGIWHLEPNKEDIPDNFFGERIKSSQTHNSIINLIDNQTDIIISARKMSADEKSYAESIGVSLIETPIALDALVFLLNKQNAVNSLTVKQIQDIYKGNITNWNELGGIVEAIKPFIRNANSGSQEMMKEIVMDNAGMPDWDVGYTDDEIISTMAAVFVELSIYQNGICFTPHYYKEYIIRDAVGADNIKSIEIDGIYPNANTIENKTYPFVANVYVSIRSDLDKNSMAYKLYEWLQTPSGQSVVKESGYVPYKTGEVGIKQISNQYIQISSNPTEGIIEIRGIEDYSSLNYAVYNLFGQMIQSGNLKQTIDLSSQKGLNILTIMQNQKVIPREKIIVK